MAHKPTTRTFQLKVTPPAPPDYNADLGVKNGNIAPENTLEWR